jgi:DNA polymerase-4
MTSAPEPTWVILHIDLDQFLAAVEVLRRPELRGLPVVVGGDGNPKRPRQVVSTASYEARAFGVHSGMPLAAAFRRCPEAVFLPVDKPVYEAASAQVMATLRELAAELEVWGWDECFAAVHTSDAEAVAAAMKSAVLARTGLHCAVGIGDTKLCAKTATGFAKPGGIARLMRTDWLTVMGSRPTADIWGIGKAIARRLTTLGVETIADLAAADPDDLRNEFGPQTGPWIGGLGRGGTDTTVSSVERAAVGRSRQVTFESDLVGREEIEQALVPIAEGVTADVVAEGRVVTRVGVTVRTKTFFTRTRIRKLPTPTTDPAVVAVTAIGLLDRFELDRPIRLLGVRVELAPPDEPGEPDPH